MLQLTSEPIGAGRERICYVHPEDPTRAIEIPLDAGDAESRREIAFYRKLERRGVDYGAYIPRFHGLCETSLGTGLVFDLVRDFDGQISRTLKQYLAAGYPLDDFEPALDQLRTHLLRDLIVFDDGLTPDSLLFSRSTLTRGRLFATGGFGNAGWLDRIAPLARRKIGRRWRRLRLDAEVAGAAGDDADATRPGADRRN